MTMLPGAIVFFHFLITAAFLCAAVFLSCVLAFFCTWLAAVIRQFVFKREVGIYTFLPSEEKFIWISFMVSFITWFVLCLYDALAGPWWTVINKL